MYLHDVEFVAPEVAPKKTGNHLSALSGEKDLYGLGEGQEAMIWGEGDKKVLAALAEMRKMQDEGLIKHIGMTGNSLQLLLFCATR